MLVTAMIIALDCSCRFPIWSVDNQSALTDRQKVDKADETILREFGDRVRAARLTFEISQETLAHKCGLHRTYVSLIERGESNLSLLTALTLATTLELELGDLVQGLTRGPSKKGAI